MEEIPKQLAVVLVLVVLISTILTTVALFNLEFANHQQGPGIVGNDGEVAIKIQEEPKYKPAAPVAAQIGITIKDEV